MTVADIYCRISREGERTQEEVESHLDSYEATCRDWIERHGMEVGLKERESDVSGTLPVAKRKLGKLVDRVEAGDSSVIVTPNLERFGRSLIECSLAIKRIKDAGGRLVCVEDGIDTDAAGSNINIGMRLLFAEDYIERGKASFERKLSEAAASGKYLGRKAPRGYVRLDELDPDGPRDARIVPDERVADGCSMSPAEAVPVVYRRRAAGGTIRSLRDFYREAVGDLAVSDSGIQQILDPTPGGARPYLGEMAVVNGEKGRPRIVRDHHAALVTEVEYEAAHAAGGNRRSRGVGVKTGKWSKDCLLAGLVRCTRGHVMTVGPCKGKGGERFAGYTCTTEGCDSRTAIRADVLDPYVGKVCLAAWTAGDPALRGIMAGDTRYADALAALEAAKADEGVWVDEMTVADAGGREAWVRGREVRRSRVDAARAGLRALPKPSDAVVTRAVADSGEKLTEFDLTRVLAAVTVEKVGRGKRDPDLSRSVRVTFVGAESPYAAPSSGGA